MPIPGLPVPEHLGASVYESGYYQLSPLPIKHSALGTAEKLAVHLFALYLLKYACYCLLFLYLWVKFQEGKGIKACI